MKRIMLIGLVLAGLSGCDKQNATDITNNNTKTDKEVAKVGQNDDWRETCASISELAKNLMINRQQGVEMSTSMKIADGNEMHKLIEALIIAAYDEPRYSVKENQDKSVIDFENKTYLECVKKLRH